MRRMFAILSARAGPFSLHSSARNFPCVLALWSIFRKIHLLFLEDNLHIKLYVESIG